MIIAFFFAYFYGLIIYRVIKTKWLSQPESKICEANDFENDFELAYDGKSYFEENSLKFAPAVFVQRYMVVRDLLEQHGPFKKIVDFGCAEFSFFNYLKHLNGTEEVLLVDQDEELLKWKSKFLKPLPIDYLRPREKPLLVKALHGNAAVPDLCLSGALAVTAIELIEHMFPPDLDALPYTLFGVIQPELVIITTPNYDFNVLFNKSGFRHLDHKFEWTRQQFKDWVNNLELRFPDYKAKLYGIGRGPEGSAEYGTCSQMVLFQRKSQLVSCPSNFLENAYHVIFEVEYPFEPKVEKKLEEWVKCDAEAFISYAVNYEKYQVNDRIEIPLSDIMRKVSNHSDSKELLQSVLKENGWTIEEDELGERFVSLPSSGIPYSSSSSEFLEDDKLDDDCSENSEFRHDGKNVKMNFSWESEETWSDHEDPVAEAFLPPSSCEGHIDLCNESCTSQSANHATTSQCVTTKTGCDQNDFNILVGSVAVNFKDKCNISSFSQDKSLEECCNQKQTCNNLLSKVEQTIDSLPSVYSLEADISNKFSKEDMFFICQNDLGKSETSPVFNRFEGTPSVSNCTKVNIENTYLGGFNNSCQDASELDQHSDKRLLNLPLDSINENVNGNFEMSIESPDAVQITVKNSYPSLNSHENMCQGNNAMTKKIIPSRVLELKPFINSINRASSSLTESRKDDVFQFQTDVEVSLSADCKNNSEKSRSACINRCYSLQHIKEKEGIIKSNRFSLCCEKENVSICDMFEDCLRAKSCGHSFDEVDAIQADIVPTLDDSCSQSKAADSGYPNTSDREMDMDLTPEQVDELLSENESSLDEREEEEGGEVEEGRGIAPIQFLDHVENGDVANNNRDGEGNNLDQAEIDQPLFFQQLILEGANDAPLDEPPPQQEIDSDSEDKFQPCVSMKYEASPRLGMDGPSEINRTITYLNRGGSARCEIRCDIPETHDPSMLASSSTSLHVHPPSSNTLSSIPSSAFPSWLLTILVDEIESSSVIEVQGGDQTSTLEHSDIEHQEQSQASLMQDEWSELILPGDVLGGGEPHTEL